MLLQGLQRIPPSVDEYVQSNLGDTTNMSADEITVNTARLAITYETEVVTTRQNELTQLSSKVNESMEKPDSFPVETTVTPVYSFGKDHKGYGLQVIGGTKIVSCGNGTVVSVVKKGKVKTVTIKHAGEYTTVYTKLGKVFVKKGQVVKKQQKIGLIEGANSKVFELRMTHQGKYIDPELLLSIAG